MSNGVRSVDLVGVAQLDEVLGHRDGSTVRASMDQVAAAIATRLGPTVETLDLLEADLDWADGSIGIVWNDPDEADRGVYRKSGGTGAGQWSRVGDAPLGVAISLAQEASQRAETAADGAEEDRIAAGLSADIVAAAAEVAGLASIYDTYAAAAADLANLAEGDLVEVLADESRGQQNTRYRVEGGQLVYKLSRITADGAQTLANKTVLGRDGTPVVVFADIEALAAADLSDAAVGSQVRAGDDLFVVADPGTAYPALTVGSVKLTLPGGPLSSRVIHASQVQAAFPVLSIEGAIRAALARSAPGDTIVNDLSAFDLSVPLEVASLRTLDLGGATATVTAYIEHAIRFAKNAVCAIVRNGKVLVSRLTTGGVEHGAIHVLAANGSGLASSSDAAVIHGKGVQFCTVQNIEIEGFNGRACDFVSGSQPLRRCIFDRVYAHSPQDNGGTAQGPANPIIMRSGTGGLFGHDCLIVDCRMIGTDPASIDPENPLASGQDYSPTNAATGDGILMQGMWNSTILRPYVRFGGEVGTDLTRGCYKSQIIDPDVAFCDKDGVILGSGYLEVTLTNPSDVAAFSNGEQVTFTRGGSPVNATGTLGGSDAFRDEVGGRLLFSSITGNEDVAPGDVATGATSGATGTVDSVLHSAEECALTGGRVRDNFIDGSGTSTDNGGQVKIQRGHECRIERSDLRCAFDISNTNCGVFNSGASIGTAVRGVIYDRATTYGLRASGGSSEVAVDDRRRIVQASDQPNNTLSLADSDLRVGLASNARYRFSADILFQSNATAKLRWLFSQMAGGSVVNLFNGFSASGISRLDYSTLQVSTGAGTGAGVIKALRIHGVITTGNSETTTVFRFAQDGLDEANPAVLLAGSSIEIERLP